MADRQGKSWHLTSPYHLSFWKPLEVSIGFNVRTNKCVLGWRFGWMVVRWEESGTHSESVLEQESLSCHRSANRPKCGRGCTHLFSGAHPPTVLSTPDTCATKPDCTLTLFLYSGVSFWSSYVHDQSSNEQVVCYPFFFEQYNWVLLMNVHTKGSVQLLGICKNNIIFNSF